MIKKRRRIFSLFAMIVAMLGVCCHDQKVEAKKPSPNVIILLVDALRPDRLGIYGSPRETSPFLDSLAEEGVVFTSAFSHACHTKLSLASLFTGLIPPAHGIRQAATAQEILESEGKITSDVLSPDLVTMAEAFSQAGYQTAAVITNPHLLATMGFDQGFINYIYLPAEARAKLVNQTALTWLTPRRRQKFFLYLHYMDIHGPYYPAPPYDELFAMGLPRTRVRWENGPATEPATEAELAYTLALYDGLIRYWDDQFREFYHELEDRGLLLNTVIVITADHGQEFYEHGGFGHGWTVYDEMIHVPLIILWPGVISKKILRQDTARHIDLFPTLGALAGLNLTGITLPGRDLFALGVSATNIFSFLKKPEDFPVYAETYQGRAPCCLRFRDEKYILNRRDQSQEYYRLDQDPHEKKKLEPPTTPLAQKRAAELRALSQQAPLANPGAPIPLDPQTLRALKSLGY